MKRQVKQPDAEDGLYGHFYTYDNYEFLGKYKFTEKANIHCGAWSKEGRIYNKGGHYPHYLIPFIEALWICPDDLQATLWEKTLQEFAYGYFIPACSRSPFGILPAGYFQGEGLLYFGSWYHGHNNIYAFAAALALDFKSFFNDQLFDNIATANLQWIAGLNSGILVGGDSGIYLPVSMIYGIGNRSRGSWTKIPGSICNGYSSDKQFSIRRNRISIDAPVNFDDEAYIAHSLPYIAALVRMMNID